MSTIDRRSLIAGTAAVVPAIALAATPAIAAATEPDAKMTGLTLLAALVERWATVYPRFRDWCNKSQASRRQRDVRIKDAGLEAPEAGSEEWYRYLERVSQVCAVDGDGDSEYELQEIMDELNPLVEEILEQPIHTLC